MLTEKLVQDIPRVAYLQRSSGFVILRILLTGTSPRCLTSQEVPRRYPRTTSLLDYSRFYCEYIGEYFNKSCPYWDIPS